MCSRKRPRCSGIASWSPRRCASADRSAPGGCDPWSGWSSCWGSPRRTIERAASAIANDVRERHLPGFVHEEHVNDPGLSSGAQSQAVPAARLNAPVDRPVWTLSFLVATVTSRDRRGASVRSETFCDRPHVDDPARCPEHLVEEVGDDLVAVGLMPTRFPSASSRTIIRAPVYVFPEPGGPWIASVPASSARDDSAEPHRAPTRHRRADGSPGRWPHRGGRARSRSRAGAARSGSVDPVRDDPLAERAGAPLAAPCRCRCSSGRGPRDAPGSLRPGGRSSTTDSASSTTRFSAGTFHALHFASGAAR